MYVSRLRSRSCGPHPLTSEAMRDWQAKFANALMLYRRGLTLSDDCTSQSHSASTSFIQVRLDLANGSLSYWGAHRHKLTASSPTGRVHAVHFRCRGHCAIQRIC
jgi:hypothetical protein